MLEDIKFYVRQSGIFLGLINPGLHSLLLYRIGHRLFLSRFRKVNPLWYIYLFAASFLRVLTKMELPCNAKIGRRLFFPHPYGLVAGEIEIGDDCVVGPWVVIGHRKKDGYPTIGNNVYIGAKATILGKIKIGDDCIIEPSAVLIKDMPPGSKALAPLAAISDES